ncbi:MAG: acyclic terpene utilization AtuA family protein [Alphaproteobacteria bacterium]|nr:acyclic terpene utilization AtuA family protein [Alphaproteobacteria bacterium]
MPEIRMMATTGMLGYGYTEKAFQRGLEQNLDFIAADSGSMDPGPHYLGEGVPFVSRQALKRDLSLMLEAAVDKKIPMLIGSAGGGGSEPQLALVREVVEEIATEKNLHFDMALIHSEQSAEYLKAKLADGKIESLGPIAELTDDEIDQSERVVAMMGVEPFQAALKGGAQVVLAGRATDASIYSAIPLMRGAHAGLSWHLSKIIECAGQVTTPRPGQDCVIGTLRDDHFLVEPGHPDKRCTRMRIAAHTLYENPSPYRLEEPDGTLVTIDSVYEQLDERIVKVSGSQFEPSAAYTVKLEGVKESGYRTVFIAGVRDPILISVIDDFIESCHERVALEAQNLGVAKDSYRLNVRVYGKNATMGPREPVQDFNGHEIGLLVDVLASDADTSKAIMAKARYALLHTDFPGRKCISGNLAIPFSPSDMPVGMTYQFNIWHRMEIDDPLEPFPIEYVSV